MQKLFPTNTTTWANIEPSSFAVNYSICPTSKDFKWLVRPIGTEKIHFLFCITRVTPLFQLICFRGVILKVCSQATGVSLRPLLRVHEVIFPTILGKARFSLYTSTKTNASQQIGCKSSYENPAVFC